MSFADQDEDELVELVESSEENVDCAKIVELLTFCLSSSRPKKYIGVVEPLADALLRLATESSAPLLEAGVVAPLAAVLSCAPFSREAAIVESCLGGLRRLAMADEGVKDDICQRVLPAMKGGTFGGELEGEATVFEQLCLLIEVLAQGSAERGTTLKEAGAEDLVTKAMSEIVNERNKAYPANALAALGC